ncbi:MAG: DUF721 domain-containing protein [Devosia sp.]
MAAKKQEKEPRRLNRAVGLTEALGKALDPALKRRGFASRDLIAHWQVMAPAPYDRMAKPDKLTWPRGEKGAEGAVLHLRCHPGHALALAYEGERVAGAVNRYFGYFLVGSVRLSAAPFEAPADQPQTAPAVPDVTRARIARTVDRVDDAGVRDALRELGLAMARKKAR